MSDTLRHYPAALLGFAKLSWELMGMTISPGQTASGVMPVARIDGGGIWKAMFGDVGTYTPDRRRAWHALTAIADGGAQPIIVPCIETYDAPWPIVNGAPQRSLPACPYSDGSTFSDGTRYDNSMIEAQVIPAAPLRATALTVQMIAGDNFHGGEIFSIEHTVNSWRLYRVRTAVTNNDGTWAITIRPPLRETIPAGTFLEFDRPKCVMRLATPGAMDMTLQPFWYGLQTVNFIEAFGPFP
jgi:hypothetical protein